MRNFIIRKLPAAFRAWPIDFLPTVVISTPVISRHACTSRDYFCQQQSKRTLSDAKHPIDILSCNPCRSLSLVKSRIILGELHDERCCVFKCYDDTLLRASSGVSTYGWEGDKENKWKCLSKQNRLAIEKINWIGILMPEKKSLRLKWDERNETMNSAKFSIYFDSGEVSYRIVIK